MIKYKNTFLQLLVGILLIMAIFLMLKNNKKRSNNMKLTYKKNKEILKKYFESWETKDIEGITNSLSEDYISYVYPVMIPKGFPQTKDELIKAIKNPAYTTDVEFGHTIFLPGLDTVNLELDGSVRVYSAKSFTTENGKKIELSVYETYDFRNDSIYQSHAFFDIEGYLQKMDEAWKEIESYKRLN